MKMLVDMQIASKYQYNLMSAHTIYADLYNQFLSVL